MARGDPARKAKNGNSANLGFEDTLWSAADKMRGHLDPAEFVQARLHHCRRLPLRRIGEIADI